MNKTDVALVLISLMSLANVYLAYLQRQINKSIHKTDAIQLELLEIFFERVRKLEQAKKEKTIFVGKPNKHEK